MSDEARFETARRHFLDGVAHLEAGRPAEAEAALRASLALLPGRPSSLGNLGAALLAQGRSAEAVEALEAALQADPAHPDTWCLLAAAHDDCRQFDAALAACDQALHHQPDHAPARFHRAALLAKWQRHDEALAALQPLLARRDAGAAAAHRLAGQALQALGRADEAERAYREALQRDPRGPRLHALLGQLLAQRGAHHEAATLHRAAVEAGVDVGLNRYLLAGLAAEAGAEPGAAPGAAPEAANAGLAPPRSPDDYVRALFDPYAEDFEQHLVDTLRYRGHVLVVERALRALDDQGPQRPAEVLDLGCGTGLCGRLLAPRCERITGIDLSPTMVEAARRSGAYHQVIQAEVLAWLAANHQHHDLVVAADVFIYIGELAGLLADLARSQRPGGWVVASLETGEAPPPAGAPGWWLQPSLRYAHDPASLAQLAQRLGYEVIDWQPAVIREDQRRPIPGAVICLRRAGA